MTVAGSVIAQRMNNFVHEGETFSVLEGQLMANCGIFEDDPTLLARPSEVESQVSVANFRLFVNAIESSDRELTHENSPS
jgi:hypothetical protein